MASTVSATAPASPSNGDLWFDSINLRLYVYYNDGSSAQWVITGPTGATGAQGSTGPTGPQGNTGAQGPQGATGGVGLQGNDGPQGATGPQGPQGLTGPAGPSGPTGPAGPMGATGPTGGDGPQGSTGPQGPTGDTGPVGAPGSTGPAGPAGVAGPAGADGNNGPAGPQGATGPQGPQGLTGPPGPEGPQGDDGPQGSQGNTGQTGPQGPQGPTGPAGNTGPQGPQGDDGAVGQTGATGPVGPQGPVGATGPQGPAGSTGPAGNDGADGADGAPGSVGPAGAAGPAGPQGPAGVQGPAGADGATGPGGPAGADGNTGPTGPIGPAGPAGPEGPQGSTGPQGPTGNTGPQGATGATGATGPAGNDGADGADGSIGPQGPAGATGPAGPQGPQGERGFPGATGPTGPAGSDGSTGPAGATGATGVDGLGFTGGAYSSSTGVVTFTSNDGIGFNTGDLRGATGPQGPAGTNGQNGNTGPQGAVGATGATGPQGPAGDGWTGALYNANTGIVTFSSADGLGFSTGDLRGDGNRGISSATVNASDDLILTLADNTTINTGNVVGPQGIQGIQGIQGPTGATGATGATGSTGATGAQGPVGLTGDGFTGGTYSSSTGVVTFTSNDGIGFNTGDLRGDGNRGITSAVVDANDDLILTLADSTTINAGNTTGPTGPQGPAGVDGDGWTGGTYDNSTGVATFSSSDGLQFSTGDLRGTDGLDGTDGAVGPDGAAVLRFDVSANSASTAYEFDGAGFNGATSNPTLYLQKGLTYHLDLLEQSLPTDSTGFTIATVLSTSTPFGVSFPNVFANAGAGNGTQSSGSTGFATNLNSPWTDIDPNGNFVRVKTEITQGDSSYSVCRRGWAYSNEFTAVAGIVLKLYFSQGGSNSFYNNENYAYLHDFDNNSTTLLLNPTTSNGYVSVNLAGGRYRIFAFSGARRATGSFSTTLFSSSISLGAASLSNGHPIWFQTSSGAYNASNVLGASDGVTNNGADRLTMTYEVPMNAPDTLYYVCENHSVMAGTIYTTGPASHTTNYTTTERNALTAQNGDLVYNSTLNKFQGYANGAWVDLH